jgi:demethylmenaquinone methyltransferase / 2-methoxy-6-polyprenyl-1,4-benzoquinol methylase
LPGARSGPSFPVVLIVDAETAAAESAAAGGAEKRHYIRRIFSEIAPRYDLLNHLLSFNVDRSWRRRAIRALEWRRRPSGLYIDLCAGTLDVGAMLARQPGFAGLVVGADFAEPMLRAGAGKAARDVVAPVAADALELPLADASAAGAIVAFGIRNVTDLDASLGEVHRVLAPGARFVVLEFSTPPSAIVRAAYHAYFHHALPAIGGAISGQRTAYRYLPRSVASFPEPGDFAHLIARAGFLSVRWQPLTFGIASMHVAER